MESPEIELAKLLTPSAAAAILGIEVTTLSNWRSSKRYALPFVRVGRAIRYRVSDLESFITTRREENLPRQQ